MTTDHDHEEFHARAITSTGVDLGPLPFDGGIDLDRVGADLAVRIAQRCWRAGFPLGVTIDVVEAITGARPDPVQLAAWSLLWQDIP